MENTSKLEEELNNVLCEFYQAFEDPEILDGFVELLNNKFQLFLTDADRAAKTGTWLYQDIHRSLARATKLVDSPSLEENDPLCPICLEGFEQQKEPYKPGSRSHVPIQTSCGHVIGEKCLLKWLHESKTYLNDCPMCRRQIVQKPAIIGDWKKGEEVYGYKLHQILNSPDHWTVNELKERLELIGRFPITEERWVREIVETSLILGFAWELPSDIIFEYQSRARAMITGISQFLPLKTMLPEKLHKEVVGVGSKIESLQDVRKWSSLEKEDKCSRLATCMRFVAYSLAVLKPKEIHKIVANT